VTAVLKAAAAALRRLTVSLPRYRRLMDAPDCTRCQDTGIVCEEHPDQPYDRPTDAHQVLCPVGMACPACKPQFAWGGVTRALPDDPQAGDEMALVTASSGRMPGGLFPIDDRDLPVHEPMRTPRGGKQSSKPQRRHRWP
jgi:hypothetical protein